MIACPTGGADVAHQIVNTGDVDLRYLAVSTVVRIETCEYPDSGKVSIVAGQRGNRDVRYMFRTGDDVDYYDGECGGGLDV